MVLENIKINTIFCQDCLQGLKDIPEKSVDLVVTDPPYLIESVKAGGDGRISKSIQNMNNQLQENHLTAGFNMKILDELVRVMKNINIYIWCNHKQIHMYLDYFVKGLGSAFDILIWNKTNAIPLFHNKYLTDKEYCLYFRKSGYCNPNNYSDAKTVFYQPINAKDKNRYKHPTIKPLNIIERLVCNSSKEGDIVLDPFLGSGTTAVAAMLNNRQYIGYENNKKYFDIACKRIDEIKKDSKCGAKMEGMN